MFDLVIKNGNIIDGTGTPHYIADIGIKDGKIACIKKNIIGGEEIIDATGLTVTPGFIDSHSHSDSSVLNFPESIEKIEQGITTSIAGQCGIAPAPISKDATEYEISSLGKNVDIYKTTGCFIETLKKVPLGSNIALFVGHSALRNAVMGPFDREPTQDELEHMGALLREGLKSGAKGLSFGLIYPPSYFAKTDELIYLATVCAEEGGVISAHIRDEGYKLYEACEEFLEVIKKSGARAVFSHHKAMYKANWGKVNHTIKMIDEANSSGFDVFCDVYPYTASHTSLSARFIPKEYHSGGVNALIENLLNEEIRNKIKSVNLEKYGKNDCLDWVLVTSCPATPELEGLTLDVIAQRLNLDVYDAIFELLIKNNACCSGCYFLMCEDDVEKVISYPRAMICTDSAVQGNSSVYHPRLRGSFPRAIGRYSREKVLVPLHEMIRKMTSMPATVYNLQNKGLLKTGFDADICIFEANTILDQSDFASCHNRASGLNYVILNGKIVVKDAVYNGVKTGTVII